MAGLRLSRATQLLLAANAVLAIVVAAELLFSSGPALAEDAAKSGAPAELPDFGDAALTAPPLAQFADMLERPLFYPDRRMPKPEVQESPPPPPAPLRLQLEGIAIASGSRVAVLRNLNTQGLLQLTEGDRHDGWTLDTLDSNSARFTRGAETNELLLDPAAGGARR